MTDSHKDVSCGSFVDIATQLVDQVPQICHFKGENWRFQAKWANTSNFDIVKTTALVANKFCTTIKTANISESSPNAS